MFYQIPSALASAGAAPSRGGRPTMRGGRAEKVPENFRAKKYGKLTAARPTGQPRAKIVTDTGPKSPFDSPAIAGVQDPTGFWDPWGFSKGIDEDKFLRWRGVELKHDRVSMLACLGYIVPYFVRLPGSLTLDGSVPFADVPMGLKALSVVPPLGWAQILLLGGLLEFGPFKEDPNNPGDFGFDPLGLQPDDPAVFLQKKNSELANGRLAMTAILGFLVGDVLNDGNPYEGSPFTP